MLDSLLTIRRAPESDWDAIWKIFHAVVAMQFNFVVTTNTRAVALWQKMGFRIAGTLPKAFRHQTLGLVDVYVMHRFLSEEEGERTSRTQGPKGQ